MKTAAPPAGALRLYSPTVISTANVTAQRLWRKMEMKMEDEELSGHSEGLSGPTVTPLEQMEMCFR